MKNIENCKLVLTQIKNHPETWNQLRWHCGATHCFAGWAQILSGKPADSTTARRDARIFLGLSAAEAEYYFYGKRTLPELETILEDFYDENGYSPDGHDRNGYNREGYDRQGYDHDGYNREGYDHDGYNREGYDRDGYDRDELNKNNKLKPLKYVTRKF